VKQDIVDNLRTRAKIRRQIPRSKDGKPDRIADMCEEAALEIETLRERLKKYESNKLTPDDYRLL
jgi:hypothetical protein